MFTDLSRSVVVTVEKGKTVHQRSNPLNYNHNLESRTICLLSPLSCRLHGYQSQNQLTGNQSFKSVISAKAFLFSLKKLIDEEDLEGKMHEDIEEEEEKT